MLKIARLPVGYDYYVPGNFSVGACCVNPALGPFHPSTLAEVKVVRSSIVPGILNQGPDNSIGDSSVFHNELYGTIQTPEFTPVLWTGGGYEGQVYWTGYQNYCFTDFLLPGDQVERVVPWASEEDGYYRIYYSYDGTTLVRACQPFGSNKYSISYVVQTWGRKDWLQMFYTSGITEDWDYIYSLSAMRLTSGPTLGFYRYSPRVYTAPTSIEDLRLGFLDLLGSNRLMSNLPPDDYAYGDLAQECADSLGYVNTNSLAFVNDFREIKKLAPRFRGWTNPKTYSSLYLAFKYGLSLTVQDTKEILSAISSACAKVPELGKRHTRAGRSRRIQANGNFYTETYRYKVTIDSLPNVAVDLVRKALEWNVYPTLQNDWDMIPFSFVVDWVLDVSSLLERLDTTMKWQYYAVTNVCKSRKTTCWIPESMLRACWNVYGSVYQTQYIREIGTQVDQPAYRIDSPKGFHNWVELGALIIQMSKK